MNRPSTLKDGDTFNWTGDIDTIAYVYRNGSMHNTKHFQDPIIVSHFDWNRSEPAEPEISLAAREMNSIQLKVGDRILFTDDTEYDGLEIPSGYTAKVIGVPNTTEGTIPLEFDCHIEKLHGHGHSCEGVGRDGYCWNFGLDKLDNNFTIIQDIRLDWPEKE